MSYSFTLSKPLQDYSNALREWSATECRPYARQADIDKRRPENWREILDTSPVPLGRSDRPEAGPVPEFEEGYWVSHLAFYEAINYGDVWVHPTLGGGIGHLVVKSMGTPEQVAKWHDPFVHNGATTGFALTEPGFGSDTSQVLTTATRDGDSWVLNGTKMYCTGGAFADYVVVFATVDKSQGAKGINAFVVPKGTHGFVVAKENEDKLGIRSWTTSELVFENCAVPLENRLGWSADRTEGEAGNGQGGRTGRARVQPAQHVRTRHRPGAGVDRRHDLAPQGPTGRLQPPALDLGRARPGGDERHARSRSPAQLSRQTTVDQGRPSRSLSAAAKGFTPETCERVIRRCMELLGPEGSSKELLLEKWYRDCKIIDIFEGSGQVQRIVVGRTLMGRLAG